MHPDFISVKFDHKGSMMRVAHGLRSAWEGFPVQEKATYHMDDVGAYMRSLDPEQPDSDEERQPGNHISEASLTVPPRNKDRTIHTPWREAIYIQWNHVFADVMNFLPSVAPDVGHFDPPNQDVLPISHEVVKKWNTHVLIIPAYFQEGLKIKVSKVEDGKDKYLGTFAAEDKYDCWFLRKGTEVKFQIEGEQTPGLEALLMLGIVCEKKHGAFSNLRNAFKRK